MAFWDGVERTVKIAGIVAGVAAAAGVYVQLGDISSKEKQKNVEEWQNAAVYKIIEDQARIRFQDIFPKYSAAASNFPSDIPRAALDEPHLRLALIRLIQSQAIVEVSPEHYAARIAVDPQELNSQTMNMFQKMMLDQASHIQLAIQVLSQTKDPLTFDQLTQKITASGGNRAYLKEALPVLIQQMSSQGLVKILGDGRVSISDTPGQRVTVSSEIVPAPSVKAILPNIDAEVLHYIMTASLGITTTTCYHVKEPDELKDGSLTRRLVSLNLITLTQSNGGKDPDNGKPCTITTQSTFTDLFALTQDYYYQSLLLLFK